MDSRGESSCSTVPFTACADRVFRARVNLHIIFTAFPYGLLLLTYLIYVMRDSNWSTALEVFMTIWIVWLVPNLLLQGTVGASLNDYLDDCDPQPRKSTEVSDNESG